LLEEMNLTHD
jgi:hypothetical protein